MYVRISLGTVVLNSRSSCMASKNTCLEKQVDIYHLLYELNYTLNLLLLLKAYNDDIRTMTSQESHMNKDIAMHIHLTLRMP